MNQSFNESSNLLKMIEDEMDNFERENLLGNLPRKPYQRKKEEKKDSKYSKIETAKIYLLKELEILNNLK